MSLTVTSIFESGVAQMTLAGRLDANTANTFKTEIEKVAANRPETLALYVEELEYMASAGIRMLVFTKQKLGAAVDIYVVAANEQIVNLLDHLRVKPLGKHGADGQHKLTKVSDRSRASKNLCCVVTLAALDLLHACRVLLGFLFLASDSEDVVHDHGHELRQTRVQITRLELIGIGDE